MQKVPQIVRSAKNDRLGKRIADRDALDRLTMIEIFGEEFGRGGGGSGRDDETIPEGELVDDAAVDSFFDVLKPTP